MLVDGVLVIGVELQQPAAPGVGGNQLFQDPQFVQPTQQRGEPAGLRQQLHELRHRRRVGRTGRTLLHRGADRLPGPVLDPHLKLAGDPHQPQHLGEPRGELLAAILRHPNRSRPQQDARTELPGANSFGDQPPAAGREHVLGEIRRHVADIAGVPEIVGHELFDRQDALKTRIFQFLGELQLRRPIEHVDRPAVAEMQGVPQPEQITAGRPHFAEVLGGQPAATAQPVQANLAAGREAEPADQLDVAKPAPGGFDVGPQQVVRLAPFVPLRPPGVDAHPRQRRGAAASPGGETVPKSLQQPRGALDQPRLDLRRIDDRIGPSQLARLGGRSHRQTRVQPRVGESADQVPGDVLSNRRVAGAVEQQHVSVGVGTHLPSPQPADGQQRDRFAQRPACRSTRRKRFDGRPENLGDHVVVQLGHPVARLDRRQALVVQHPQLLATGLETLFEPRQQVRQRRPGGASVATDRGNRAGQVTAPPRPARRCGFGCCPQGQ